MNHKTWLDNEYKLWVEALQESTVHNFKEHPQVKRMLGEVEADWFMTMEVQMTISIGTTDIFLAIDSLGHTKEVTTVSGTMARMIYYGLKIKELNPKSICEIGGGVGQFYAVLKALGYEGDYYIYDLEEVKEFQWKYLAEVEKQTGLNLPLEFTGDFDLLVSFYALGEFDDDLKEWYLTQVIPFCPHGFIIWNGHSGASKEINIKHKLYIQPEQPLTLPGNLQITW